MTLTEIRNLLEGTEGRIFTVLFRKRTPPHELREMTCRTGVKKGLSENPDKRKPVDFRNNRLVCVWDMKADGYRSIPLEGVIAIKDQGVWQQVKVRIIGLISRDSERCYLCGERATIYVDIGDHEITPACNGCVGPGEIGSFSEVGNRSENDSASHQPRNESSELHPSERREGESSQKL